MKPITNRLANIATFILVPFLLIGRKAGKNKIITLLAIIIVLTGCFQHYYRTHTQASADEANLKLLLNSNKYFIIHFNSGKVVGLNNVSINNNKIEGTPVELPPEHSKYLNPATDRTNRVKHADKGETLLEVHLYTANFLSLSDGSGLSLPLSSFNRMDVYTFDQKATSTNHILSVVGIVVGVTTVAATILVIAVASSIGSICNCPQVYINNNGQYEFKSGVYSGAIYSSLERTDYLPLPSSAISGNTCQLKIASVKNEEQFINRIQLMQVSHPAGTAVLADRHGTIFSYDAPKAPVSAIINGQTDIKSQLLSTDNDSYLFDSEKGDKGFSNVVLTFNKPVNAKKVKLIVHGGNSLWSGYLYHSFAAMFGNGYDKWKETKDKSDTKEMEQWQTDQQLPMMMYIEKNGQWEFSDYFAHTGNTASRDMIMELDVSAIQSNEIKIKLETVYQFWNLDFAGIDFSDNKTTTSNFINASSAVKTNGADEKETLNQCDKQYCHLGTDEEVVLQYQVTLPAVNNINSYFLVSSGYYHNQQKYEGKPDLQSLMKFKEKGEFDRFSRNKYAGMQETLAKALVKQPADKR